MKDERLSSLILFDSSMIQCLRIFGGINHMLLIGAGEVMGAAEIFLGTHI